MPIEPILDGHTLLLPKRHSENILDIDQESLSELMATAQQLARQLVDQHVASGINLLHAAGNDAQQSVFHFHLHLVPRRPDDGLDLWFREGL